MTQPSVTQPSAAPPAVERSEPAAVPVAPVVQVAPAAVARPAAPGQVDAVALRGLWPEVLIAASRLKRRTEALLRSAGSQINTVDGTEVVITANTAVLAKMLSDSSNTEVVQAAITEVIGGQWRVSVTVGDGPSGSPAPAAPAAATPAPTPTPAAPEPEASWPTVTEPPRTAEEEYSARRSSGPVEDSAEDYDLTEPTADPSARVDLGIEAMALLQSELGARPLEDR